MTHFHEILIDAPCSIIIAVLVIEYKRILGCNVRGCNTNNQELRSIAVSVIALIRSAPRGRIS